MLCTGCGTQLRCHWLPRAADEACRGELLGAFQPLPPKEPQGYRHTAARSAALGAIADPFLVLYDDFEAQEQAGLPDQPRAASAAAAAVKTTRMAPVVVAGNDWETQLGAALEARSTSGGPHATLRIVVGEHNLSTSRRVDCRGLRSAMQNSRSVAF